MKQIIGLIAALIFLFLAFSLSFAADLKWDASTGEVDGYNVYLTANGVNYNKNVGEITEVQDIDSAFNLYPGKEYVFTVTAWNVMGESERSNAAAYTAPRYSLPGDNLPATVVIIPGPVTIIVE